MNRTLLPIVAVMAMVCAVESCSGPRSNSDIEFATMADSVGYKLNEFAMDSSLIYCAARYNVVWPEKIEQQDLNVLSDSLMSLTFGYKADDVNQAAKDFLCSGLDEMRTEGDTTFTFTEVPFPEAYAAPFNNVATVNSEVSLLTTNLLVVDVTSYTYYYGAAHGMQTRRFLNYSLVKHQLLTPANTFKADSSKAILDLINREARAKYPGEGVLFAEPIVQYSNFQITNDEIVFVYQPYEVGPYSSGIIQVPISKYDLYNFLTPEAIATLNL